MSQPTEVNTQITDAVTQASKGKQSVYEANKYYCS